jgi:hypothetical protein
MQPSAATAVASGTTVLLRRFCGSAFPSTEYYLLYYRYGKRTTSFVLTGFIIIKLYDVLVLRSLHQAQCEGPLAGALA